MKPLFLPPQEFHRFLLLIFMSTWIPVVEDGAPIELLTEDRILQAMAALLGEVEQNEAMKRENEKRPGRGGET